MNRVKLPVLGVILVVFCGLGLAGFQSPQRGPDMVGAANAFLVTLTPEQQRLAVMEYSDGARTDWHFIPKDARKGLPLRDMTGTQRLAAHHLLATALSEIGYDKAAAIRELEALLKLLQDRAGGNGPIRDTLRYYWTVFGEPSARGTWGLSVEGHHQSFNFVVVDGRLASVTPMVLATNPATIKDDYPLSIPRGTRVVHGEEQFAFDLLASMSREQRSKAVVSAEAIREVRNPGLAQAAAPERAGIRGSDLEQRQKRLLRALIQAYLENVPPSVASSRLAEVDRAGYDDIYFGWWGGQQHGEAHYFRVEGPTVLIELANTQADSAGNAANHIHAMLRDPRGDFLLKN